MPILQITYGFNGSDNRYGNWINVFPGEDTMWVSPDNGCGSIEDSDNP